MSHYRTGKTNQDLLKQETVSGSGISWAICKSAPQTDNYANIHHSGFYRPDAFPAAQPTASSTEGLTTLSVPRLKTEVSSNFKD